ncbi:OadG family protein [Atopobacter phocae]|uniref:OadG family protein n=1 Tax=Atopobacter phocae TaxID=136492 RepID=UPI000470C938|nr:OadG family protein [Atopobacter phocae]
MNPIADAFQLLIVAMLMVFIVLVGLMFMMETFKKFATMEKPAPAPTPVAQPTSQPTTEADDEYRRVAALVALAVASEEMSDRHFVVESIERLS